MFHLTLSEDEKEQIDFISGCRSKREAGYLKLWVLALRGQSADSCVVFADGSHTLIW